MKRFVISALALVALCLCVTETQAACCGQGRLRALFAVRTVVTTAATDCSECTSTRTRTRTIRRDRTVRSSCACTAANSCGCK